MKEAKSNEKLLSPGEVKVILEKALKEPTRIYDGPETDEPLTEVEEMSETEREEVVLEPEAEQSFEKRATMEHVTNLVRMDESKVSPMVDELTSLERVSEVHAYKIVELMPRDETELRPVFAKERFTLTPEEMSSIMETIDKYRS